VVVFASTRRTAALAPSRLARSRNGPVPTDTIATTRALGRDCEVSRLGDAVFVASCEAALEPWLTESRRWAHVHHYRGTAWEARHRPAGVRAALGATAPGVVYEPVLDASARAARNRGLALTFVALTASLTLWGPGALQRRAHR